MGLSRRAYAAHRAERGLPGGSHTAVNKAIATGRITPLADGTIDPAAADRQWAQSTDASQQRSPESIAAGVEKARAAEPQPEPMRPMPAAAEEAVRSGAEEVAGDFGPGQGITFQKARTVREALAAQLLRIKVKREHEQVVDRAAAKLHVMDLARKERDHWLQLPARHAAMLAAELEVDAHALEVALDRAIREHLELLTEIKVDLRNPEI